MSIIERLAETAQEEELPFLLIGGYAVSFHGYSRFTKDIDVLIRKADLPEWTDLLNRVNYSPVEESPAFVRFESSDVTLPVMSTS